MDKIYVDMTRYSNQAVGIWAKDHETVPCGTSIWYMDSEKVKKEEYDKFKEYDINFIFDDYVPEAPFYTVPYTELIAKDSKGGWFGILNEKVCYFSSKLECFDIAESLDKFIENAKNWRSSLVFCSDVKIYESKAAAEKEIKFTEPDINKLI